MVLRDILRNAFNFRHFIFSSIVNENKARFAHSKLGWTWMVINPLAQSAVLALVLSKILNAKFPGIEGEHSFAVYLLSGMLGWSFFLETVTRCSTVFLDNASTIKKINFPKVALPFTVLGSSLINHALLFVCTLFIYLLLGHGLSFHLLFLPLVVFVNCCLSVGLGLLLGIMNVFIRDVGQALPTILQFWFWVTPIVYKIGMLPESLQGFFAYNPMYYIISGYQSVLAFHTAPSMTSLGLAAGLSFCLFGFVLFIYRRASSELVDEL